MRKIILSIFVGCVSSFSMGQAVVAGVSPAAVKGNYAFGVQSNPGWPSYTAGQTQEENWGMTIDFNVPGTYIQAEVALVDDGTPGTNPQGIPIRHEGCSNLINPSEIAGKIALVYRNTCDFATKVKKAEDAGAVAVIIINREDETNIIMTASPTGDGPNTTLPAVIITKTDGDFIVAQAALGPVEMLIGNKIGAFDNDLSLSQDLVLIPPYNGVHFALALDGSDFNFDLGLRVYNQGLLTQTDASVKATVTNPLGDVVYDETVLFSLNGSTGSTVEEVDIFPGELLSFPNFQLGSYPHGEYTLTYEIMPNGVADDFPEDNTYSITFVVNNTYHSRARLDPTTLKPMAISQARPSDPESGPYYSDVTYCSSFRNPNADRVNLLGMHTVISIDSVNTSSSLLGLFAMAEVYEWVNADAVYLANTGMPASQLAYNLQLITSNPAEYSFENDVLKEEVYFDFPDAPITLENNKVYLACVTDYGQKLRIGFDRGVNFNATSQVTSQWINPLKIVEGVTVSWYGAGFGADLTPAFGLHFEPVDPTLTIKDQLNLEGRVYPNPANDIVRINVPMDGKAVISVTDLAGRNAATHSVNFLNNETSIDLVNLESGMYVINVAFDNGSRSTFNVIKR